MKRSVGAAALALALVAAPAHTTTTFAQFKQADSTDTISFGGGDTLSNVGGATVLFDFANSMPPAIDGDITATMIFTANGSPYSGTLQFLRTSDNANLLTATFTGATLAGGGTTAAFFDSAPDMGGITYTSDFLDFTGSTQADFSLGFSGLSAAFDSGAWTADVVGTFASDTFETPVVIPEPATWLMMIMGFGAVGAVLRRRPTRLAPA